ncbi:MAG: type VI secretion system contractile sheath large subunit, partial [Deltaproteobacteria bacterium]|nr:type VI secretion system contractile sheath large subunit [Deltaproteobacteria bacterium]
MAEEKKETVVSAETQVLEQPSLLEDIIQATNLKPSDENYSVMKRGLEAFLAGLLEPGKEAVKVSKAVVDDMIVEIDRKMSNQLDAILHQSDFQKLP